MTLVAGLGNVANSHDFEFRDAANNVWNGSAYVTPVAADYLSYRVAGTPDGMGEFTATAPAGAVRFRMRIRGASLAASPVVWEREIKPDADAATAATQATAIKAKTDLIGTGIAFTGPPVTASGQLTRIVIGDDYNAANGRAFSWTFDAITGFTVGSCTAKFGLKHATNPTAYNAIVTAATVTDLGSSRWKVDFDVDKADTASLPQAHYEWSVEIIHSGEEVTIAKSEDTRDRVKLVLKQT